MIINAAIMGSVKGGGKVISTRNALKIEGIGGKVANKTSNTGKIVWPPNDGGVLGTEKNIVLQKGYQFDRYGLNKGSYVSPVGTPYEMRALAPGTELKPYKIFEVVKPVRSKGSVIAPWFNQPGGGIQFKLNNTVQELLDSGRIIEVTK